MNGLSTIAEAVKVALQTAALGQTYTVQRCFMPPDYDTAATKELKLLVIGFEEDVAIKDPDKTKVQAPHIYGVKIAIVKRVIAADVTDPAALIELDALSDFREAVIDFLKANTVMGDGTLDKLKNSPAAYDPPTLGQRKTFVSVIAADYKRLR